MNARRRFALFAFAALLLALSACAGHGTVQTRVTVGVGYFYDHLAVYGDWHWTDPYGWVWAPWDVGPDWRPYTLGHWVYSVHGWTWVSDWTWGWAPFHYGRWRRHAAHRWVWIPGTVWAPAWVTWRRGEGVVGWAPLPPQARWRPGVGLSWDGEEGLGIHSWSFVRLGDFPGPRVEPRLLPRARVEVVLGTTRRVNSYEARPDGPFLRGVPVGEVERANGPIPRVTLRDVRRPGDRRIDAPHEGVRVFRPEVRRGTSPKAPPPSRRGGKRGSGRGPG